MTLKCYGNDDSKYGCISSQFVDAIVDTTAAPPQWFGRITRFGYRLEMPDGTIIDDKVMHEMVMKAEITSATLPSGAKYTVDPNDASIAYAEGTIEIVLGTIPIKQTFTFRHKLTRVWRITETKLS